MRMRKYAPILILAMAAGCGPCGYNRIVSEEQQVEAAWSQVENQLQRRADLIPNLVETVKGPRQPRKGVFDEIAKARRHAGRTAPRDPDRQPVPGPSAS
jgi:LemA protein